MSRATVELDFFRIEKESSSKPHFHSVRTLRGIQNAISKIHPELLKSVIASASTNNLSSILLPSTPKPNQNLLPPLPLYAPLSGPPTSESPQETSPMTIFYNGTVAVFDVHRDKAENILKLVAQGRVEVEANPAVAIPSSENQRLLASLDDGDLPIARKKSLQRFLEKRKERLTTASPYDCHA